MVNRFESEKIARQQFDQQKEVNRAKCATLYRKYQVRKSILDSKSYFTKTRLTVIGNDISTRKI